MTHRDLFASSQDHVAREEAITPMRPLTTEELLAVVGGPVIDNGGGGVGITSNSSTSS